VPKSATPIYETWTIPKQYQSKKECQTQKPWMQYLIIEFPNPSQQIIWKEDKYNSWFFAYLCVSIRGTAHLMACLGWCNPDPLRWWARNLVQIPIPVQSTCHMDWARINGLSQTRIQWDKRIRESNSNLITYASPLIIVEQQPRERFLHPILMALTVTWFAHLLPVPG